MNRKRFQSLARMIQAASLAAIMCLLQSLMIGATGPLTVGLVNEYLLAPAFGQLTGLRSSNEVSIEQFSSSAELRDAFASGSLDMIIDSGQSLALLPYRTLSRSSVIWDVASSFGSIGIITSPSAVPLRSAADLGSSKVLVEAGTPAHYFLLWLGDVMNSENGSPLPVFRRPDKGQPLVLQNVYPAIVAEEPVLSSLFLRQPHGSVLVSTANYRPIVHYMAMVSDASLKAKADCMVALIEAVYEGQQSLSSWENLLGHVAQTREMDDMSAYVHMKHSYLDKAYNTDVLFAGKSLGPQISSAIISTHMETGAIWQREKASKASGLRLSDSVVSRVKAVGSIIEPSPPPWSGEVEIMRFKEEIHFDLGRSEITQRGREKLDQIAGKIKTNYRGAITILVEGYADSIGTADFNLRLSAARAASVASYLRGMLGLPSKDVQGHGLGVGGDDPSFRKTIIRVFQKVVL